MRYYQSYWLFIGSINSPQFSFGPDEAGRLGKLTMSTKSPSSLFNILNGLRYLGVGAKVTRKIYKFPETYWIITKTKLSKDQLHGKVWGQMVWRGRLKPSQEKIGSPLKNEWTLVDVPDYKKFDGVIQDSAAIQSGTLSSAQVASKA